MDDTRYPFLIRVKTPELPVLYCLRGLSMYAEGQGDEKSKMKHNVYQPWKGTGRAEWEVNDGEVTFRFSTLDRLETFEREAKEFLGSHCRQVSRFPEDSV